jgi:ribonucleotide reductase alpha subunit
MTNRSKDKGRKWDGKSRVSNDLYRKNFDEIFKKRVMEGKDPFMKEQDELKESYEQSKKAKKEREKLLKELEERNGF